MLAHRIFVCFDEFKALKNDTRINILKNLVTGKTQRVRQMHRDTHYEESYLNICVCGNDIGNLVDVGPDGRRFELYYCDVDPLLKHPLYQRLFGGDRVTYFEALFKSLFEDNAAGLKTFANLLYNLPKIEDFDITRTYVSPLLIWQKINSMKPLERFWLQCLISGRNTLNNEWQNKFSLAELYDNFYLQYPSKNKKMTEIQFYEFISHYFPSKHSCKKDNRGTTITLIDESCIDQNLSRGQFERQLAVESIKKCKEVLEERIAGISMVLAEGIWKVPTS